MDRRRAAAALLALAACIACSAAAPMASNHTALELHDGPIEGCYYNFQHYGEGDRIMTNEPCLNCTCHNRMLMCYLRVCPFTKAIGQDCTVEKRADQCCPIVTCPDVPVDLLTSTSASSPAEYGATGIGKLDKYGCSIHGKYFPEGSKVPPTPNKPCEHCYCIRNMTTCVMQECTLHVDGCTPIYHKDVCCPVRYSCDHPEDEIPLLDDMTTTVRPTQGFLLTTTTMSPVTQISQACVHDDQIFADGALIRTEKACEHCYCMKGDIVCVVQECGTPMENEGKNCTSLPPRHGQCCPDTYICEGDERVTDTTTEFGVLTSLPPRRVGVEGSGYRNEPDEAYTEISPIATEIEGSGEDFATGTQMYTGENVTPEKEFIDETLLTTTDTNLHLSQSTEPDKGQNTIPDSVTNKEAAQEPIENELSSSSFGETMTTATKDYTTVKDLTSRKEEIGTTESVFKTDSESNLAETLTSEEHEKATSESTHLLETTTFTDEIIPYTNPTISESDKKATTLPSTEYTTVQDTSKLEELSTELHVHSDVTEKDTDIFHITPESEILIESTTYPITNIVVAESTSINPNINEIDDNGSLLPTPSRIPGEGDCLLNGITYTNNTNVPSTNNCHTGCKCISSIIKCDPIICSPPPEYMENMNDCQPIYDTPNSCCPTYVCSVQETIPPESHSHMSGTESPKPIAATECSGNDCNDVEDNKLPSEATICTSDNCLSETPAIEKECESNDCTDQTSPSIPTQDCSDGKCQILPVVPCEGENCKDAIPETDNTEPTKTTAVQEKCESNDCKDQVQTTPSIPSQECSDGKCEISPTTLCEGEKCAAEKDLESGSQDVPPKICNDENGCDDSNIIIVPKECVGETCKRKDFPEEKVPLKCSGSDCKQHDEPTVQSTEQANELVTEGSTITDINLQKTETLESHITSSDELVTESVTKQPIHIESPEILSTTLEQIVTESPDKYDMGKETIQTDGPSIQTITEIAEEVVKEALPTEPPKLSIDKTTESQDIASPTDEQITSEIHLTYTKEPEYLETDTKKAFTKENELLSTDKPHIYTDSHTLDEIHTKLPEISETESEKSPTEPPELLISGTDGIKMESPESTTQKEVFVTNPSEKIATEKETIHSTATEISITVTEAIQTTSFEKITEKEMKQPETLEAITEKEVMGTEVPDLVITQKEQAMETFTDRADTQTEVPETYATGKDVIVTETSKVTVEDKKIIQTEIPEIVDAIQETSQTESPAIIDFEKITIETVNPDIAITTKYPIVIESELPTFTEKMQTMYPDATIIIKDEVLTDITEATIRKEDGYTPDLHKTKIESTTEHELDQSLLEEQTSISSNLGTDEDESVYVTKETMPKPKVTEKPEITSEDKEHDESHEPKSTTADEKTEISTESLVPYTTYEIVTERIEPENTKPERMPEDKHIGVTESISEPTLSGTVGETTTKQIHKITEEPAIYTKLPHGTETEEEAVTDKNLSYTSIPDVDETKSDDSSQSIDMSVTESQVTVTKAPEMLSTQNAEIAEISTVHDAIVTDKYKEVSDREPESTLLPINEITEKQDQHTEAPEKDSTILQAQDKTTILPEQYTTLEETILTTEKGPHKEYETPSSDSNLEEDKKDTEKIHRTTLKNIEELATTEISNFVTEIPELHLTEPSTDQKFDSESSLLTTKIEDNVKELESSTVLMTDIGKTQAPEFIEVIEQDLTSKIPQQDIATESYEEKTSENLPSHSTYKEELPTEQPLSQETSNTKAGTELYIETSTKTITENEKEKEDQVTTSKPQTTQSSDTDEFESALPFTNTPESEIFTQIDTIRYTPKDEDKTIPHGTEKDSKPFVSDEKPSDTTEELGLQGAHTTQTSLPNIEDLNKNEQESNEEATEAPESITTFEQSTLAIKEVTTESYLSYTSPEDKLSTMVLDHKEVQKEQQPDYNVFLTTSTSLQPEDYKKITELPMSQITHIDHASQTTVVYEEKMTEHSSETTVKPKLEEEKAQTSESELQNQSTETSDYHVVQQEKETESSTKLNVGDDFAIDHAEKTTMPLMEDEYSIDRKPTTISQQQTDFSKDIPTPEIIPDMYTEGTPVTDTKEVVINTKSPETTTVLLPITDVKLDLSHKHETPFTESIDESVTKSPQITQTVQKEIITTPSILLDDEHLKETISTEAEVFEQLGLATEYPETDIHDMHSISPEKETAETEKLMTETPEISTEKEFEPATSVYVVPTVAKFTEKPMTIVTEINEPVMHDKDHKQDEIVTYLEEETTKYVNLEETTEKDILYTHSKPLYTTEAQNTITQSKESNTEALDRATTASDQTITDNLDKDKINELISPHSSTQIPEISTSISLTQTEATGIDKTTFTKETPSEEEKPTLIVKEKEDESQPEKFSTQSTVEKEIYSTESTPDLSQEKVVTDVHIPSEFMPTTSEKSYTEAQTTQTHKEFDVIGETKPTTEQGHEFSETTPFLIELNEHTHQIIDKSSRTPVEEILTTPLYEPQQTERGDQNLDVTEKYEDENQTSVPIKVELEQENEEKPIITHGQEQVEDEVTTMSSITVKNYTDRLSETVTIPTSSPTLFETEIQEKEEYTTTVQDVILTTSAAPQTVSEKESFTTISTDAQNFTYPVPESSSLTTEKDILLVTEEPLKSEASIGTTLIDDELLRETSKTTTSKIKEETTTHSLLTDKSTQLEEKPFKTTPSPSTQELTKPEFDDEISEGIPSPDFPPSGAGGYGQEPDYIEEDQAFGPGTCRYGGKMYVSAQQIPRDDPCDFCFCFRSDIICLQQSCPPPIHGCHEEPIQGFCCPRYECPVSMATTLNVTTTTTTTTTTLPPHFLPHAYKGAAQRRGCQIKGHIYKVGEVVRASSGPCLHCTCGGDGQMKCDPKACTPEPMLRQMIAAAVSAKRRR